MIPWKDQQNWKSFAYTNHGKKGEDVFYKIKKDYNKMVCMTVRQKISNPVNAQIPER